MKKKGSLGRIFRKALMATTAMAGMSGCALDATGTGEDPESCRPSEIMPLTIECDEGVVDGRRMSSTTTVHSTYGCETIKNPFMLKNAQGELTSERMREPQIVCYDLDCNGNKKEITRDGLFPYPQCQIKL